MNSFRVRRYLVALLWSWLIPFSLGCVVSSVVYGWSLIDVLQQLDQAFTASFEQVVQSCAP